MKNKTALVFGIVLLLAGIIAYVYYYDPYGNPYLRTYPYQTLGLVLAVAGIAITALAFLYSPRKTT